MELHKTQLNRLKRIEGQVRGISKMIEEGRYCMDILIQIRAIKSAVNKVESNIVQSHLNHCVEEAVASSDTAARKRVLEEISVLLSHQK